MIDLDDELVLLRDVPGILPRTSRKKKVSMGTVFRWANRGIRGTKLDILRIGHSIYTSRRALDHFFQITTIKDNTDSEMNSHGLNPARQERLDRLESELIEKGS